MHTITMKQLRAVDLGKLIPTGTHKTRLLIITHSEDNISLRHPPTAGKNDSETGRPV